MAEAGGVGIQQTVGNIGPNDQEKVKNGFESHDKGHRRENGWGEVIEGDD